MDKILGLAVGLAVLVAWNWSNPFFKVTVRNHFRAVKLLNYETVLPDWSGGPHYLILQGSDLLAPTNKTLTEWQHFTKDLRTWSKRVVTGNRSLFDSYCNRLIYYPRWATGREIECPIKQPNLESLGFPTFDGVNIRLVVKFGEIYFVHYREPAEYFPDQRFLLFRKGSDGKLSIFRELLIPPTGNSCGFKHADLSDRAVAISGCKEIFIFTFE